MTDPAMRSLTASVERRSAHVEGTTLNRVWYPVSRIGSPREPGRGGNLRGVEEARPLDRWPTLDSKKTMNSHQSIYFTD